MAPKVDYQGDGYEVANSTLFVAWKSQNGPVFTSGLSYSSHVERMSTAAPQSDQRREASPPSAPSSGQRADAHTRHPDPDPLRDAKWVMARYGYRDPRAARNHMKRTREAIRRSGDNKLLVPQSALDALDRVSLVSVDVYAAPQPVRCALRAGRGHEPCVPPRGWWKEAARSH